MGVILPQQVASASSWTLTDFLSVQRRSAPAAGGLCTLELEQVEPNELWLIDHAVIACDSSTPTVVRLYAGSVTPTALLDGSDVGGFDVADWPNGLQVQSSTALIAQWTGASDGAVGVLTLQIRSLRR